MEVFDASVFENGFEAIPDDADEYIDADKVRGCACYGCSCDPCSLLLILTNLCCVSSRFRKSCHIFKFHIFLFFIKFSFFYFLMVFIRARFAQGFINSKKLKKHGKRRVL